MQNVSPVSLTFHFSDELICGGVLVRCCFVVLWFLCVCWGFLVSLIGSCSSHVVVLEPAAFCYERPWGRVACLASLQCSLCFTCSVGTTSFVSLEAKALCVGGVFVCGVCLVWLFGSLVLAFFPVLLLHLCMP